MPGWQEDCTVLLQIRPTEQNTCPEDYHQPIFMFWIPQPALPPLQQWNLQQQGTTLVQLHFNPAAGAIRMEVPHMRVFLLESEGLLNQRISIRTEYGHTVATLKFRQVDSGWIRMDGFKYQFYKTGEVLLLKETSGDLPYACGLEVSVTPAVEVATLLFGMVWYQHTMLSQSLSCIHVANHD